MLVKLSSKGQLVIPKAVRRRLGLKAGSQLRMRTTSRQIILEPTATADLIDALYGKYAGSDLLDALEQEHRREVENDRTLRT